MLNYNRFILKNKHNDYDLLISTIKENINDKYFDIKVLGEIENDNMYLITPKEFNKKLKTILIVSSFHGNEIAPVYALNEYIKDFNYNILKKVNVSIIPVVNVNGFKNDRRYNKWHEKSNYGYCLKTQKVSVEGQILLNNDDELKKLSKNGFLTMHEDNTKKNGFLYVMCEDKTLPKVITDVRDVIKDNIGILKDKTYHTKYDDANVVKDGIILNHFDGTYENYIFKNGADFCLTSETPARDIDLKERIDTNVKVINTFVNNYC
jgi:hypothetical protein